MPILDTPEQIEMFRLLQLKHMLAIEIRTGLRHSRGSVLTVANDTLIRRGWTNKPYRTKQAGYDALCEYINVRQEELFPSVEPS